MNPPLNSLKHSHSNDTVLFFGISDRQGGIPLFQETGTILDATDIAINTTVKSILVIMEHAF